MQTTSTFNKREWSTNWQFWREKKANLSWTKNIQKEKWSVEHPFETWKRLLLDTLEYFKKQYETAKQKNQLNELMEETKDELRTISKIVRTGQGISYSEFYSSPLYKEIKEFKNEYGLKY